MFIGEYRHTIDNKRRLAIPAKFRKELGNTVVVAKGLEGSLFLYTLAEWKILAEKLANLPLGKAENRSFVRTILAGAVEVELDRLGRILVPDYLTDYASLKKNTIIVGLYNRLEIWDEEQWNKYKTRSEKKTDDIAEKLGELGVY
jgi:MraZ protein